MISVIMPLYNAETFLEEALASIQKQTYIDFELICVNDASNDGTVDIVKKVMDQDSRIKLFHNDVRSGAAVSRNKGLKEAQGDYVAFLDGDDIFEETMLEKAYCTAKANALDIVVYELLHVPTEKIYEKKIVHRNENFRQKLWNRSFCIYDLKPIDYVAWSNGPCNKLFRMEFLEKNRLEFQTLQSCNDVYFVEMAFMLAERISFLDDESVMVYARDHFTPTRISFDRNPMCAYEACKKIIEELIERNILDKAYQYFYLKCYFILLGSLAKTKSEQCKIQFYKFLQSEGIRTLISIGNGYYEKLDEDIRQNFQNFELKDYETLWFEEESIASFFIKQSRDKIINLCNDDSNIVIWGTGYYGKRLVQFFDDNQLRLKDVVDADKNKQGKKINNYYIKSPEEINFKCVNIVIAAAKGAFEDVRKRLGMKGIKVVDLSEIIDF